MATYDIVYIVKSEYDGDELRYSLRSVCANFPYNRVWIYGGKPSGIEPDMMVEYRQTGANKWERVSNTLKDICRNKDITDSFWLFNDDFFIMRPVEGLQPMVGGSLWGRAQRIARRRNGRDSTYSAKLKDTARILNEHGYDCLDYALHVPMLINRKKALQTLTKFEGCPMFRSLYGNHHEIGGVIVKDVKIQDVTEKPTGREVLLSTDDNSFKGGEAGRYIREAFPIRCKYESRPEGK